MENNPLGISERYGVQRRRVRRILVHLEFKVILEAGDDALLVRGERRGESSGEGRAGRLACRRWDRCGKNNGHSACATWSTPR